MATPPPPSASIPGAIHAPDIGWSGQSAAARMALHQSIHDRETADIHISYVWLVLFIAAPLIQSALFVLAWFMFIATGQVLLLVIFGLIAFASPSLMLGVINRRLLRRMSRHFDRENRLRAALIDYLHSKAAEDGKLDVAAGSLLQMSRIDGEALVSDRGRSIFWAFIVALPVIRYYFFWFITRFPNEHEQRWLRFLKHTETVCRAIGVPFHVPLVKPIRRHNFWLFAFLSLITFEYFLIFWVFLLIREGHVHFQTHVQVDDAISLAFH